MNCFQKNDFFKIEKVGRFALSMPNTRQTYFARYSKNKGPLEKTLGDFIVAQTIYYLYKEQMTRKKSVCTFLSFKFPLIFVRGTSWTNQSSEVGASCTASLSPEISRFLVSEVRFHNFWKALSSELFRSLDVTQYDSGRLNISFKQDLGRFDEARSTLILT